MKEKKVLILGAKGTLGQALLKEFKEMVAWDREEGDLTDPGMREKILELKPAVIINATGYNDVDKAEEEGKETALAVNAEVPKMLAQVAKELGAVFVNYSSDYVFKGDKEEGYVEDDKPEPISEYGKSKYEGEKNVQAVGGKHYIIRPSLIFGKEGTSLGRKRSFVHIMLDLVEQGEKNLKVVDEEKGSPTYANDLARLTRKLIEGNYNYGIYHGANEGGCTRYQWAKKIFEIKGIEVEVTPVGIDFFTHKAKRPRFSILLNTKLPKQRRWEEALEEYLRLCHSE